MRLAVVAGGWHWPIHFYREITAQADGADLYVVAHRHPEHPAVRAEKRFVTSLAGPLGRVDQELYAEPPTLAAVEALGWRYEEAPNVAGDQCFLNQWLERHDYRAYDAILNCHDDTYVRRRDLFEQLDGDWLILANGASPDGRASYFRGSFEFWRRELLDLLGGRVDLGPLELTRVGLQETPGRRETLQAWNSIGHATWAFLEAHGLSGRVRSLSPYYRVSPWVIEGERGLVSERGWGAWSLNPGLAAYPL